MVECKHEYKGNFIMMILMLLLGIIFSSASLAWGYNDAGLSNISTWIIISGIVWLLAIWRHWRWFPLIGLIISLIASALGLWLGLSVSWMFSGAIFALVAWDMMDFRRKLSMLPAREDVNGMERRHLIRVGFLVGLGLLISWGLNLWISK